MGGMGWDGEIDEDEGIDPVRFDLIDMTDCSKSELDGAKERSKDRVEGRTRICRSQTRRVLPNLNTSKRWRPRK